MTSAVALIRSVLGKPAWQIRWDHQVGLRLDFGSPWLHIREPRRVRTKHVRVRELFARRLVTLRGSHYLWISPEAWRIVAGKNTVVRRASSSKACDRACAQLCGEALIGVSIEPATGNTVFRFDLGGRLEAVAPRGWGIDSNDDELWSLWGPRERFTGIYAGGYSAVGRTTSPDPKPTRLATRGTINIQLSNTSGA